MGGGASKGAKKPAHGSETLLQAGADASAGKLEVAKKIFKEIDTSKNGKLSKEEIKEAVKKYGKDVKSVWTATHITETIAFYDRDKDGELNEAEFLECIKELNTRGAVSAEVATPKAAGQNPEIKKNTEVYEKYKDGDTFQLKHLAKLVRDINDEEGIWEGDAFGKVVKAELAKATGSEERSANVSLEAFLSWYPGFMEQQVHGVIKQRQAEQLKREQERAHASSSASSSAAFTGEVWNCPMGKLMDAYSAAWEADKTPLLIDCSTPAGENPQFSPLETFFSYSSDAIIELKKAVVETSAKKEKTVPQVQDEFAEKLLRALKQGQMLVLLCANSAPPFRTKFSAPHALPEQLMDVKQVKPVLGADGKMEGAWPEAVVAHGDGNGWQVKDVTLLAKHGIINDKFRVAVVTKFSLEDYAEFLGDEWPLSLMQPIKVVTES